MTDRPHSHAVVTTAHARRYMIQLCKHFGHKRPTSHDDRSGHIGFDGGDCRLEANAETLALRLDAADAAQLQRLQDVVASHLLRFAFREPMQVTWQQG